MNFTPILGCKLVFSGLLIAGLDLDGRQRPGVLFCGVAEGGPSQSSPELLSGKGWLRGNLIVTRAMFSMVLQDNKHYHYQQISYKII
jgi:hypothetical protein